MTKNKVKTQEEDDKITDQEAEGVEQRVEDLENQVKRVLADYQNLEKRTREERSEWIKRANKELLLRLLPVLDTLMLAGQHVQDQGVTLSIQQFLDVLKQEGIDKIETVGKEFDPHVMECVQTEEGEEGKVTVEVRPGYTFNDSVLRPALVKVGAKGEK